MKSEIESAYTEHLEKYLEENLEKYLNLAIDEAKCVRQLIETRDLAEHLEREEPCSDQLAHLNREISYLENKLEEIRNEVYS